MSTSDRAQWIVAFLLAYLIAPVALILGWIRWYRRKESKTMSSTLSFIGFALATISGVLGLCMILLAQSGGLESHSGTLWLDRTIQLGGILSLGGILFSIAGVWRKSPTRWQAPASSIGTLAFWLIIAILAWAD
jgi:hypothetical protein